MGTILRIPDLVTADSIKRAKAHQAAERAEVERVTGIQITDTPLGAPLTIVHCRQPGCRYKATARREGQAINSIAAHLVRAHMQEHGNGDR